MKRIFELVFASLLPILPLTGFSQDTIEISGILKEIQQGRQPGYKMKIPLAELKTTEKEWGKYIGKGSNAKVIRDKSGIWIKGARAESISRSPLNIYSNIMATSGGLLLEAFFESDSVFIDDLPDDPRSVAIRSYLAAFGVATYRAAYQGRIDAEENILKQLEDELKGLQGEKGKLEKSIREKERSITGNEEKIEENKLDAERISKDIEKQKDMVHEFRKDPEKEKLYKKELQSLKKQKNRMLKDREKLYGGIDDHKEAIRKAEADIEKNNSAQQAKENEIAAQKDKIAGMEVVLKKIK